MFTLLARHSLQASFARLHTHNLDQPSHPFCSADQTAITLSSSQQHIQAFTKVTRAQVPGPRSFWLAYWTLRRAARSSRVRSIFLLLEAYRYMS
jgi:hypothetical protein